LFSSSSVSQSKRKSPSPLLTTEKEREAVPYREDPLSPDVKQATEVKHASVDYTEFPSQLEITTFEKGTTSLPRKSTITFTCPPRHPPPRFKETAWEGKLTSLETSVTTRILKQRM
jgi:hypothetical protein